MEGYSRVTELAEAPARLLEAVVKSVSSVGVELPALGIELIFLILILLVFYPIAKKLKAQWPKIQAVPLLAGGVLALILLATVYGIVEHSLIPDSLAGTVRSDDLTSIRLALLDLRDRPISVGSGAVDTISGDFILYYNPLVDGRARRLRISSDGCVDLNYDLPRSLLVSRTNRTWSFRCQSL